MKEDAAELYCSSIEAPDSFRRGGWLRIAMTSLFV
jgi:hypothetical protein